ncbi:MAG TPA: agenet domain-containing protein [Flavobacteriales bacterium]|nr:agenet domain-containing protein [Flavobacteriales bacterium]HMR28991.1 agenet domain-containing protein [Flavobacteriales bacterium]
MRTLLPLLFLLSGLGATAQRAGDKVQIESAGAWYPGKVLEVKDGQYFVSYDGWSETFNEWVGPDRIKGGATEAPSGGLTKFKVGDKVEVEYGMVPEPATVIEVGENKYHIKFDNGLFGDKWVTEKEIKKL